MYVAQLLEEAHAMARPSASVGDRRWIDRGGAKTAFRFVLTRARWAIGAYVEVGESATVRVMGVDGVRRAVDASAERTQSAAAHDACHACIQPADATTGLRGKQQRKQLLQHVGSDDYIEACSQAAQGQQENDTDVQTTSLSEGRSTR